MTLYDIIADLRRGHPTPATTETLDMVVAELGRTRDNLKSALQALSSKPIDELQARAHTAGIDDLDYGPDPFGKPAAEPLDEATAGIGALLALSSLVGVALAVAAVVVGVQAILNASG